MVNQKPRHSGRDVEPFVVAFFEAIGGFDEKRYTTTAFDRRYRARVASATVRLPNLLDKGLQGTHLKAGIFTR